MKNAICLVRGEHNAPGMLANRLRGLEHDILDFVDLRIATRQLTGQHHSVWRGNSDLRAPHVTSSRTGDPELQDNLGPDRHRRRHGLI